MGVSRFLFGVVLVAVTVGLAASPARAQTPAPPSAAESAPAAPPAPVAPTAAPGPAEGAAEEAAGEVPPGSGDPPPQAPDAYGEAVPPPASDSACVPTCREGFVCASGQCVSACNPPCPDGQRCTAAASCEAPPPPSGLGWSDASAPPPGQDAGRSGRHAHDGFFLRGTLGIGRLWLDETHDRGEAELGGGALALSLDIGGALVENLVLHGRLGITGTGNAGEAEDSPNFGSYSETSASLVQLGPALTYYLMPANVYFTFVLAIGGSTVRNQESGADDEDVITAGGASFGADVGWEGWVGDEVGLGGALRFEYFSGEHDPDADSAGENTEIRAYAIALVGSITYQ